RAGPGRRRRLPGRAAGAWLPGLDRGGAGPRPGPRPAVRRRARRGYPQPGLAARARPVTAEAELGRRLRLGQLADEGGVFALAAADHRDALRTAYVRAGLEPPSDEGIRELKTLIVRELAPH